MEIRGVLENLFRLVIHQLVQKRKVRALPLLFPEIPLLHGQAETFGSGPTAFKNDFRNNEHPNVYGALFVADMAPYPIDIEFDDLRSRFMQI